MVKIAESLKKFISPEALLELEQASSLAEAEQTEKQQAREQDQAKILKLLDGLKNKSFKVVEGQVVFAGTRSSGGVGIAKTPTRPLKISKDGVDLLIGKGQETSLNGWFKSNGGKVSTNGNTGKPLTVSGETVKTLAEKQGYTTEWVEG